MKQVGINTIKIVLAAIGAILLADWLHLENAISAGIVAVLTIQPTKRETMRTALSRCLAFLIALAVSYLCFQQAGYNEQGFFLYLIFFTFICQRFNWIAAIAMNSVIISHFIGFGNMNAESLYNEGMIFLLGMGIGILANLHLHKNVSYIEQLKDEADAQMKTILHQMRSTPITVKAVSDYLEHISKEYHKENTVRELLDEYRRLDKMMERIMLPKNRGEFEDRALLYVLFKNIEAFLRIKQEFIRNWK